MLGFNSFANPAVRAPKVGIGMPAFNSAKWIEAAVGSLLAQTYTDFELVISDNASTDDTYDRCMRIARSDSRVRVLRNDTNLGANRNYSVVLDAARGQYFKWAASSDLCAPTFIEQCVEALDRDPSAVLACPRTRAFESAIEDDWSVAADMDLRSPEPARRFVELLNTPGLNNAFNGLIRRDALVRASRLGVYTGADVVLMCELAFMGKFLLIDEPLFFRRMSKETATKLKSTTEADQHLVPTANAPLSWQRWRYVGGLLKATRFAGFPRRSWFAAATYVARAVVWSRKSLMRDAWYSLRRTVS